MVLIRPAEVADRADIDEAGLDLGFGRHRSEGERAPRWLRVSDNLVFIRVDPLEVLLGSHLRVLIVLPSMIFSENRSTFRDHAPSDLARTAAPVMPVC